TLFIYSMKKSNEFLNEFTGLFLLFYLGFQSVKQGISHSNMEYKKEEVGGLKQSFMAGFFIKISNPLNLVFWFGIFGSTLSS
ncbi:LysE family transporter, partial [Bacillus velezensis]|uniref:LysE family transporter n=1 Tax=Bacillus velezensis TaxID=492670 RepID=UPI0020BF2884